MSDERDAELEDGFEELDDATVAVQPAADESTVDETVVVRADIDETVVARVSREEANRDETNLDETVVAPQNPERIVDETLLTRGKSRDRVAASGEPGEPVIIAGEKISPSLAKLLFKKPLDPKRRAPESPFPKTQSSLPRGGVRSGIPVAYGARAEEMDPRPEGTDFSRWIGPSPLGYELPPADRHALSSSTLMNRRFRLIVLFGGPATVVVSSAGLWWVVTQLMS
ncbi:MAG: hypothetical protein ACTIJ6_00540 [Leucobacter sp.]